jgi:hypothetical protein
VTAFEPMKFLTHCLWVARAINHPAAFDSAARLEEVGTPLLDGLEDKVRKVIANAELKGKS